MIYFKKYILSLFIIFIFHTFVFSQPVPYEFFENKLKNILYDSGNNWDDLTAFGPSINYISQSNEKRFSIEIKTGQKYSNYSTQLFIYSRFKFRKNLFGVFYPKYSKNSNLFNWFSNIPVNSVEEHKKFYFELSGITYHKNWVTIQLGRGRESWGAGSDIQLALNERSNPYDYFSLSSDYGKIRVKYVHGFLEKVFEDQNRYIVARGIEFTNKKSSVIGISEIVIYSGLNRSFDIAHFNPISSHLETEFNDRLNFPGSSGANAVWQFHFDYLFKKSVRLSWNFLIDELVLDKDYESNKQGSKATSSKISFSILKSKKHLLNLYFKHIFVGSFTFSHWNGTNNFVQSNKPLGWVNGSDGEEFSCGFNYIYNNKLITSLNLGLLKSGQKSIKYNPYVPYVGYDKQKFPTGIVKKNNLGSLCFIYKMKLNSNIFINIDLDQNSINTKKELEVAIGLNLDLYRKLN